MRPKNIIKFIEGLVAAADVKMEHSEHLSDMSKWPMLDAPPAVINKTTIDAMADELRMELEYAILALKSKAQALKMSIVAFEHQDSSIDAHAQDELSERSASFLHTVFLHRIMATSPGEEAQPEATPESTNTVKYFVKSQLEDGFTKLYDILQCGSVQIPESHPFSAYGWSQVSTTNAESREDVMRLISSRLKVPPADDDVILAIPNSMIFLMEYLRRQALPIHDSYMLFYLCEDARDFLHSYLVGLSADADYVPNKELRIFNPESSRDLSYGSIKHLTGVTFVIAHAKYQNTLINKLHVLTNAIRNNKHTSLCESNVFNILKYFTRPGEKI